MSPKRRKDVSQLVEKYRSQFPDLERPLLRKLIRLEHPELFKNNPSNRKTLDRHLKRAFKHKEPSFRTKEKPSKPSRLNVLEYLKWLQLHGEQQRDKEIRELEADFYYTRERYELMNRGEWTEEKDFALREKWFKRFGVWDSKTIEK